MPCGPDPAIRTQTSGVALRTGVSLPTTGTECCKPRVPTTRLVGGFEGPHTATSLSHRRSGSDCRLGETFGGRGAVEPAGSTSSVPAVAACAHGGYVCTVQLHVPSKASTCWRHLAPAGGSLEKTLNALRRAPSDRLDMTSPHPPRGPSVAPSSSPSACRQYARATCPAMTARAITSRRTTATRAYVPRRSLGRRVSATRSAPHSPSPRSTHSFARRPSMSRAARRSDSHNPLAEGASWAHAPASLRARGWAHRGLLSPPNECA